MSKRRSNSSPELLGSADGEQRSNDSTLEGARLNSKLSLKLIPDHTHASQEDDVRKPQRVTGMMTILDDIKSRLEKSQFPSKREAELRRCNTDLRRGIPPKERKPQDLNTEENHKLRKELNSSMMARKNLENMFTSLGKEKAIMTTELARKAQEVSDMEELVDDLKAQNETLTEKVKACAAEHKPKKNSVGITGDSSGNAALQERNKVLSEQLLKSLDGYRWMKRKLKEAQEENARIASRMEAATVKVAVGIEIIHGLHQRIGKGGEEAAGIDKELAAVEEMLLGLQRKLAKGSLKGGDGVKPVLEMPAEKPSGLGAEGE